MRKNNLFKPDAPLLTKKKDYAEYIGDSLKPLGFEESLDNVFYEIKKKLFMSLYEEIETSGASYDPVIAFQSIVDDLVETFHEVAPSLHTIQRDKETGEK